MSSAELVGTLLGDSEELCDVDEPQQVLGQELLAAETIVFGVQLTPSLNRLPRERRILRALEDWRFDDVSEGVEGQELPLLEDFFSSLSRSPF